MHSELVWCKTLTSPCEKVPDQVEHQSWEAAVNVSLVPFGEGLHHQSHGERATSSPLKLNSDTRLPPVAEGNTSSTYLQLKEEPPDYDIICVKREVCDQSVGGEGGPPLMPAGPAALALLSERAPPSVGSKNHSFGVLIQPGESTVPSETCRTSRMSNREKLQRYRARIRADPEKYRAYREMDRRRYQMRKKSIKDLPEQCQKLKREAWREASRRHRARKKICPPAGPQINLMALTTEAPLDSMRILQSWK
ncbi:hypothetical protein AGOR_G00034500 [Albula goreensis]|uniref:Uncharacterized protein n=1 Tax=Albula goreensis TaxID=1534307 RepID=A0A8T3E0B5_9TELE|nr:hypothetical protein AGOR_G00034500 [Albula goreensis]